MNEQTTGPVNWQSIRFVLLLVLSSVLTVIMLPNAIRTHRMLDVTAVCVVLSMAVICWGAVIQSVLRLVRCRFNR